MHETLGLPASMAFVAALAEFLGGLGLIAGLLGRVAAGGIVAGSRVVPFYGRLRTASIGCIIFRRRFQNDITNIGTK